MGYYVPGRSEEAFAWQIVVALVPHDEWHVNAAFHVHSAHIAHTLR